MKLVKDYIPNWINENSWTAEDRIRWLQIIMALNSRDWSIKFNKGDIPESLDPTLWKIWCLVTCDTKKEAIETWKDFVIEYNREC